MMMVGTLIWSTGLVDLYVDDGTVVFACVRWCKAGMLSCGV
jgi:hypothetical protein